MSVIEIRPVKRTGARVVLGIGGVSGSGKTYSAILLAYGLANYQAHKVGFLDTENRRGSLYANILPEPFMIGDLAAPFSPGRYIEAIEEFQRQGVEVLVIDSVTHEWEGPGGCEEIAAAGGRMPNWKAAKQQHKQFVNAMLLSDMHIIACLRAREKTKIEEQWNEEKRKKEKVFVPQGVQPIQEKNFMFEMTASCLMQDSGRSQTVLKCPKELVSMLGRGNDYLTAKDGKALRDWIDGADADPLEGVRNRLRLAASRGTAAMRDAWEAIAKREKSELSAFKETLKAQAAAVDQELANTKVDRGEPEDIRNLEEMPDADNF